MGWVRVDRFVWIHSSWKGSSRMVMMEKALGMGGKGLDLLRVVGQVV